MITKDSLDILKKINIITDKVILKSPITTINSDSNDIVANIKVEGVDEPMGLYELSKFNSILSLFDDAEVNRDGQTLKIKSKNSSAIFTLADINIMDSYNKPDSLVQKLFEFPSVSEFVLNTSDLASFKKASSIFSDLNSITVRGQDGNTQVCLNMTGRFETSSNNFNKEYLNTSSKEFLINIPTESFNKLPIFDEDYKVQVKYNENKNAYRIVFSTSKVAILVACSVN